MVVSSHSSHVHTELPAVDERLIAPETGYEIDDGRLVHVAPSDEDHAVNQCAIGALLRAHRSVGREVAVDMLTRTSERNDFAPDASVYPSARDPLTGGRQLEELAFEVLATSRLGDAGTKAAKLTARGVRRVFAIDVAKQRAFEWSRELGTWEILAATAQLDDAALAVPLPVAALVDAAVADDATVRAYRAKRHPEFLAERKQLAEIGPGPVGQWIGDDGHRGNARHRSWCRHTALGVDRVAHDDDTADFSCHDLPPVSVWKLPPNAASAGSCARPGRSTRSTSGWPTLVPWRPALSPANGVSRSCSPWHRIRTR